MLVDGRSHALVPAFLELFQEQTERIKTELFECLVETTTPICETASEVLDSLQRLRAEVAERADAAGLAVLASGSHPFGRGDEQPLVDEPRYRKMADELGDAVHRQLVCGLHVHVGMPSREACLNAFEGVLPWLPTLLSLSANSPYLEGEEAGARSGRAGRLAELPGPAAPPVLRTWAEWETLTAGRDYTRMWWDVRPHPRFGTLEVRMADQQTDVRRSAGIAALVQALAMWASEGEHEPLDREEYTARRAAAAVDSLPVDALADLVERPASQLGGWPLAEELLAGPPEAERQLAVGRPAGTAAVAADLVERSQPWRSTATCGKRGPREKGV